MDDIDRELVQLMFANPRMQLKELGKRLGISAQAVHHRMQVLTGSGPVLTPFVGVSIYYVGAIPVAVFGKSDTTSVKETLDRLGGSEFTSAVVVASGNHFFIVGELRDISDLDGYAEFVRRVAKIPAPAVGIYCLNDGLWRSFRVDGVTERKQSYKKLTLLDFKIIASLKDDVRRPVANIAGMVGASARTVRRRLQNMISDGSLALDMRGDPTYGGDVEALVHVNLREGADKGEVGRKLLAKYPLHITCIRSFGNLPMFLLCIFYGNKLDEILKVLREIGEDPDVVAVMPNITCAYRMYEPWRIRLPAVMIASAKNTRARDSYSGLRTQ